MHIKLNSDEVGIMKFLCSHFHNEYAQVENKVPALRDVLTKINKLYAKIERNERARLPNKVHKLAKV